MRIAHYEIQRQVAQGGMGVVYQAVDPDGTTVALKLIQVDDMAAPELEAFRRRFHSECAALKKMDHPRVVRYLDEGEHEGRPYLVQEFIRGVRLTDWLKQRTSVAIEVAVQLGLELLDALVHVHACGVSHRDVNPNNILLVGADDPTGPHVRLIDFGFARIDDGRTHTWVARGGTKYYAAPEQAIFPAGSPEYDQYWTTPASDVYGAMAVLFHLLLGRPPYSNATTTTLDFVVVQALIWQGKLPLWQGPDEGASLSRALRNLLTAGVAPRPEERPASMTALRDGLMACPEVGMAQVRVLAGEVRAGRWTEALHLHRHLGARYPGWPGQHARFLEAMLDGPPLGDAPPDAITAALSSLCALAGDPASRPLVLRAVISIGRTWGGAVAKSRTLAEHFRGQPGATALGRAFLSTFQPEPALTFFDPSTDASLRGLALLVLGRFGAAAAAVRVADVIPEPDGADPSIEEAPVDDLGQVVYAIASTSVPLAEATWPRYFDRPCGDEVPGLYAAYAFAHALHLADVGQLDKARAALTGTLHALQDIKVPDTVARNDLLAAWIPPRRVWVDRFRRRALDALTTPPRAARAQWLRALDQRQKAGEVVPLEELLLELDIVLALFLSAPAAARGPGFEAIRTMAERPGAPREAQLRVARALLHLGEPNEALALAQKVLPPADAHEERLWVEIVGGAVLAARRAKAQEPR
jgi:hypothetical protein